MNIKDPEAERLVAEVARRTGKSKTAAVREAMRKELAELDRNRETVQEREARLHRFMEEEIWPFIPPEELDQPPMTKAEVEEILGIGPEGW